MDMKPSSYSSLFALTLSGVLIVMLKSHALVQYWQQSRHILLDVAPPPAMSDLLSTYLLAGNQIPDFSAPFSAIEQQLLAISQAPWPAEEIATADASNDVTGREDGGNEDTGHEATRHKVSEASTAMQPPSNSKQPTQPSHNHNDAVGQNTAETTSATTAKKSDAKALALADTGNASVDAEQASDATARLIAQSNMAQGDGTALAAATETPALKQPSNATLNSLDAMGNIELEPQDRVLLIGDSLMQGLAPHLVARFKKKDQIQTVDMSRHSTGLTYPAFYNWPNAVKQAFTEQSFDVMIVFMGANDPWDMTVKGKYIRFASPRWNEIYSERVRAILEVASANNTRVIWLSTPPMGREDIKAKIPQLNQLYKTEIEKFAATAKFIDTAPVLTKDGVSYSRFIELPERGSVMLRTDDGIHFTTQGHRLLSKLTLAQFRLPQPKKNP
jgi:hypothetical protein